MPWPEIAGAQKPLPEPEMSSDRVSSDTHDFWSNRTLWMKAPNFWFEWTRISKQSDSPDLFWFKPTPVKWVPNAGAQFKYLCTNPDEIQEPRSQIKNLNTNLKAQVQISKPRPQGPDESCTHLRAQYPNLKAQMKSKGPKAPYNK
jgi:hypothetical protein